MNAITAIATGGADKPHHAVWQECLTLAVDSNK